MKKKPLPEDEKLDLRKFWIDETEIRGAGPRYKRA